MSYFDCGKRLDVKLLVQSTQRLKKFDVPFGGESGMETSHHMDLCDTLIQSGSRSALNFRDRHLESMRVASASAKSTKLTGENANIGVVDVTIEDIGSPVAVLSFTDDVGYLAEGIQIIRPEKSKRFVLVDTFASEDLLMNVSQCRRDQPGPCEIFHKPMFTHIQSSGKQTPFPRATCCNSYLLPRFI
jgi:hypothetical protein